MVRVSKVLLTVLVLTSLGFSLAGDGGTGTVPTKPKPGVSTSASLN